eukprot:m.65749 g.65749  ORF g.65749 m.65749 type:complete len:417 (-) comp11538_c2_seq1:260-1510(-)
MKVFALVLIAVVASVSAERVRRDTSDLLTIHDAAVSLEASALDNRYKIAGLEVSVQLAATQDDVDNLADDISTLRSTLTTKGSRATFDVLKGAAQSAHEGVRDALDGITAAAADIPAANLEVNMVVSQVSAVHALFEFTGNRVDAVESNLEEVLSQSQSIEDQSRDILSTQGTNIVNNYNDLVSKANALDEVIGNFDFEEYLNLVNSLWQRGLYNPKRPVYRYNVFSQYSQNSGGWYADNNADLYGGVRPSEWTGSFTADKVSANKDTLRSFFIFRAYGGANTNVWAEEWYSYSSTNSRTVAAAFRIKNTLDSDVTWSVNWYYSSYGSWGDLASVAVNGQLDWSSGGTNCGNCNIQRSLTIPKSRTSTVIFVSGSGPPSSSSRSLLMVFHNNCLDLPNGLEFVDDLDYVAGDDWST